jgi:hypothetical protein
MADATTDAIAAFRTNRPYARRGSAAMCEAFIQACADLLVLLPGKQGKIGSGGVASLEYGVNLLEIAKLSSQAEQWYASNVAGIAQVVHPDFRGLRDFGSGYGSGY